MVSTNKNEQNTIDSIMITLKNSIEIPSNYKLKYNKILSELENQIEQLRKYDIASRQLIKFGKESISKIETILNQNSHFILDIKNIKSTLETFLNEYSKELLSFEKYNTIHYSQNHFQISGMSERVLTFLKRNSQNKVFETRNPEIYEVKGIQVLMYESPSCSKCILK